MTYTCSERGEAFLQMVEGFEPKPYPDSAGNNTIAFGHLILPGEHFSSITREQGVAILKNDIAIAASILNRWVKADLTQYQVDALVSFVFNEGAGGRSKDGFVWLRNGNHSTMLGLINSGNLIGVSQQFPNWCKAGGVVIKGLLNRRLLEQKLFMRGDYGLA